MYKQQKAKTLDKDTIKDLTGFWFMSTKYDGHQIFIEKAGDSVRFFTSNGKEFYIEYIADEIRGSTKDFLLVGEYLYNCDGKLGSRAQSSKITTFRTNFNKGLKNSSTDEELSIIKIFDCIPLEISNSLDFKQRYQFLDDCIPDCSSNLHKVGIVEVTLEQARYMVSRLVAQGWEGGMLIRGDSFYNFGKRVHHAVKIKGRPTADLYCIGVTPGLGRLSGSIGSLKLVDREGIIVYVGSGLTDEQRKLTKDNFIGNVIEIEYEQKLDTYIQPVFKGIRKDKQVKEID